MKAKNLSLCLIFFSCLSFAVFSSTKQTCEIPQLELAGKLLEEGAETFDVSTLNHSRKIFLELYNTTSHDYLTAYRIARVDSKLLEIYQEKRDKKRTSFYIEEALQYLYESLQMNDQSSDTYCLLAGVLAQKVKLTGIAGGLLYQKKTSEYLKKAMEIDPDNPDAYVGFGISYIVTPFLFGGDLDKGIDYLKRALELDPEKYRAYVWLGKAFRRKGQMAKAKTMFLKVLAHNPNDLVARNELDRLPN